MPQTLIKHAGALTNWRKITLCGIAATIYYDDVHDQDNTISNHRLGLVLKTFLIHKFQATIQQFRNLDHLAFLVVVMRSMRHSMFIMDGKGVSQNIGLNHCPMCLASRSSKAY